MQNRIIHWKQSTIRVHVQNIKISVNFHLANVFSKIEKKVIGEQVKIRTLRISLHPGVGAKWEKIEWVFPYRPGEFLSV